MKSFHTLFNSLTRNHAIIRRVVKQHTDTLMHTSHTSASTFVVPFNSEPRRTMLVQQLIAYESQGLRNSSSQHEKA